MTETAPANETRIESDLSLKEVIFKLVRLFKFLLSKWVTILLLAVLGGSLGIAYSTFRKPTYTAVTTFVLEEEKGGGGLGSLAGLASMAGVDLANGGGGIFQGDNILELYKSRKMIEQALRTQVVYNGKKQLLVDCYITFNQLRTEWDKKPALKNISFNPTPGKEFSRLQDSLMGTIVSNINRNYLSVIKPDKKLSIIKVDVNSKDEYFAKVFNDEIVKRVNDFYVQTKTKKALENVKILDQKTDSVRRVMNGAIYSAAAVADATPNLNYTRQTQRMAPIQRSQFSAETNKAILSSLVQNLEMSKIALRKDAPLIQVIDEPIYPLDNDRLGKLKGGALGAFIFGTLTLVFLLLRKIVLEIIK